ncbi:hypothetical protein [Paenibacillus abyssi]|uniref:Uncharacterized protein n=1 Tax=Paenibacillus abyssi TaxID=1340531 RepID=A0A917CUQ7_9BACL|nr:hypothetical protein [Paenibacillus abyssi]GGF98895.1 hypothetical protein GCM10010916_15210 [Paenibacillus abyssi]
MTVVIMVLLLVSSVSIWWMKRLSGKLTFFLDALGFLALLIVFAIASASIIRTLLDNAVFMTQVHEVLLNPLFIIGGAYLGPYFSALLFKNVMVGQKNIKSR